MNQAVRRPRGTPVRIGASACPHDCPSTCAFEIEAQAQAQDSGLIGRVRGAPDYDYAAGVIGTKVARYAERAKFAPISWDAALDLTGADAIAPFGGAAFHDNRVWIKRANAAPASP